MKKGGFGKNKPVLITIVALVVLAAMILASAGRGTANWFENAVGAVLTPVQGFAARASNSIADFFRGVFNTTDADKENAKLKSELALYNKMQLELEELKKETRTIIIYEAPHHLIKTVTELYNALGDRELTVCRELTKKHEEKVQTTFSELLERSRTQEPRGEYVLVICGRNVAEIAKEQQESWEAMPLEEHMAHYESQGIDRKEAMKLVAKDRGVSKRDIYKQLL